MLKLNCLHHISIICSNYELSKKFYTEILGFTIIRETYRQEKLSYKLDLSLNGQYVLELFSFPSPPSRVSSPEAAGLRHLAFEVDNLNMAVKKLQNKSIVTEQIKTDETTGKRFTFISDPDNLPVELYEK